MILAIVANRELRGKFVYELPENVVEVHELYLDDLDWCRRRRKSRMNKKEYQALRSLLLGKQVEWEALIDYFQKKKHAKNVVRNVKKVKEAVLLVKENLQTI